MRAAVPKGLGLSKAYARAADYRLYEEGGTLMMVLRKRKRVGFHLIDAAGAAAPIQLDQNVWQYANVAMLDFENNEGNCNGNPATNTTVTGTVPDGEYVRIVEIGIPEWIIRMRRWQRLPLKLQFHVLGLAHELSLQHCYGKRSILTGMRTKTPRRAFLFMSGRPVAAAETVFVRLRRHAPIKIVQSLN